MVSNVTVIYSKTNIDIHELLSTHPVPGIAAHDKTCNYKPIFF